MTLRIEPMTDADYAGVAKIFQEGIDTGNATFAMRPPADWDAWNATKVGTCSLVARRDGRLAGWAALSPFSARPVYSGVAEVSIYIGGDSRGLGVGAALMEALIRVSEANGFWTLTARIFPENAGSLALHRKFGFREVGRHERLGRMEFGPLAGRWRDVVLMERRSRAVGLDGA